MASVSFVNLTHGNPAVLYIGDQWQIEVRGRANVPVSVVGGKNGAMDEMAMGQTDGAGIFRLSGTITGDQIGAWFERWNAGGELAGQFSFNVPAQVSAPVVGAVPNPTPQVQPQIFPSNQAPAEIAQLANASISGVPVWVLAAGALGAWVLFGGRRR